MEDIKTKILADLKQIDYPGYNRDIVSFGIVKDIIVNNNKVLLLLKITTDIDNHKDQIKNKIISIINTKYDFESIDVQFSIVNKGVEGKLKSNIKKMIAIASCKGGVGKSTIALNIASKLAENFKVGLLDLDIYGPSLPTLIGEYNQPEFKDNKIIPIKKFNMELMSFGFINNENSPAIWRGPMVARMTQQFFDNVAWGDLDYLILDLPPGTGDIQLTLVQKIQLTGAIIITTPQDLSIVDVQKGSEMFKKVNVPLIGIIENMSEYIIKGKIKNFNKNNDILLEDNQGITIKENGSFEIEIDVFKGSGGLLESTRLGIPLLEKIPLNPLISESSDSGVPYVLNYPDSAISTKFNKIISKIT